MANLKIFISSTCYDLNIVRSQLRNFVGNFGYDPVMSDYADVLYDPRIHTHTSCIQEVTNCDILILIIGSRFGGKAIPTALESVDLDFVKEKSNSKELFDDSSNISITQLEVIKAIESSIPIFTFVENKVMHDHLVYEKNKDKDFISGLDFPSFAEKPETAKYVFEFINFLRHRIENNSIVSFNRLDDIESYLKKQWSGLLQRLLYEQRFKKQEEIKIDYISNQIADIKTAIMTSISSTDLKDTARGAIKFRQLVDFFRQLKNPHTVDLLLQDIPFDSLLGEMRIVEIFPLENSNRMQQSVILLRDDSTFFEIKYPIGFIERLRDNWQEFIRLTQTSRQAIINAIYDTEDQRPMRYIRYVNKPFSEFAINLEDSQESVSHRRSYSNSKEE
ncbi:DUF4062 domain-containing protein [Paenibacillus polymyxa]|uniref:DUF4062 domain-containing protein n=1 Tax=Paenibacillus polymyxa TaxID=1406 RepID=UPI0004D5E059|nr:DUF4062 domain-containing protein [Paenibacillus polymyxa]KEO80073.1 hypothetical protein EL23_00585 [Paenibacillus polymyxa]MCH6186175.1 DUF4062 domain-containing protein [Paenibacillus polymyxa]MDY8091501.1 DUF4062 domain-containing protein [Paenibacillus polymyxa]WRL60819.1 DUF4062 domain-containing protein [Paenibacillus polymyxa]